MSRAVVLIVDDDQDFLDMTRIILEAGGFRVASACDPDTALDMMMEERPDLVVTDLMMQTMDSGFSLSRKIKENPRWRDLPVIVVTAVGSRLGYDFVPRNPDDLTAMHADAFIEKPISPEELLAKIADLLNDGENKQEP